MREVIFYTVGIWGVIMIGCFISWVLDVFSGNNWGRKVTAEDLKQLGKFIRE